MEKYSAILEMYYGKRGHTEFIKPTEEYCERAKKMEEFTEKLRRKLKDDKECEALIEELFWARAGLEDALAAEHYREGFSFGVLMGMEIAGTK